jgi:putative nucleotidyltransferase with HDIG domain
MADAFGVVETLRQAGHSAYLVGGCVRDRLLGKPAEDRDVATAATPDEVLRLFPGARLVGAHFGVVLVGDVEVATYRTDLGYRDGRHPEAVQFESDPERDAQRRDFTINGMFLDPATGQVLDFVGGRRDLEARLIRAIGDPAARFEEDRLRMLRAVRFAARLGFDIEPATFAAICKHAAAIRSVAAERVRDELTRLLTEGGARRGFELLLATGLLEELLPEVAAFRGVEQPPEFHPEGDVWTHVLLMLGMLDRPSATLAWGVLLHDVGKPDTFARLDRIRFHGHVERGVEIARDICARLRFSNDDADQVVALVANHMRFADAHRMKESTLKRFLRLPRFEEHLELHRLDCLASHGRLDTYEFVKGRFLATPPQELRPARLLTGADLIAAGWIPGPDFSRVLDEVEDAQLEGRVRSKEEALALAARIRRPPSA